VTCPGAFSATRANLLLGVVGTRRAPTDAKRPVGVISLIGGYGRTPSPIMLNSSEEISRGRLGGFAVKVPASPLPRAHSGHQIIEAGGNHAFFLDVAVRDETLRQL
jgi:hypothetical protein